MKRFQTLSSQFSSVNLLTVLILCALTFGIMGCDGGVGEVAVIDAAATDAAAGRLSRMSRGDTKPCGHPPQPEKFRQLSCQPSWANRRPTQFAGGYMQGYRPTIAINILALLVGCVVTFCFVGRDGGTGKATAGNAAAEESPAKDAIAKDATAKAATGSPVPAAADDAGTGRAIAGSPDCVLNFPGDPVTVTPFIPDFRSEDYGHNLVEVHRDFNPDDGEFYDGKTGQLWAVSITTGDVYRVEELYLDLQHARLHMKTIRKKGEPASWGHFDLTDSFASKMKQAGRLEFTAGNGVRRIFVLAGSSASTGQ